MYGSASGFTTYHEDRGRTVPDSWTDAVIEAALLVASEWVDNRYGDLFMGFKTDGFLQEREWPRTSAYTNTEPVYVFSTNEIPDRVVHAAYEAAFREATTQGSLYVDYDPSKYKSVSISGALSVDYNQNLSVSEVQKQIQIVEQLLKPLFDENLDFASLSGSTARV